MSPNDNGERIDLSALPLKPLSENDKLPNVSALVSAAYLACRWIVLNYQQVGFTAWNARNRLQQRMDQCLKAKLWDGKHYTYVAYLYREAIHDVYGERVTFKDITT